MKPLSNTGNDSEDTQIHLTFPDIELARQLFGEHNSHLQRISTAVDVHIHARGNTINIKGDPILTKLAENILQQLYNLLKSGYPVFETDVDYAVRVLSSDDGIKLKELFLDTVYITSKKHAITPKSKAQKDYIDAIRTNDIVFGIGPAGTGKTYLAMAMAVAALSNKLVNRIILTRPAVEAGEARVELEKQQPGVAQHERRRLSPAMFAVEDQLVG